MVPAFQRPVRVVVAMAPDPDSNCEKEAQRASCSYYQQHARHPAGLSEKKLKTSSPPKPTKEAILRLEPFLSSSRRAPFFNFGVPPDDAPNALSTQWNTEKPQRFFI